MVQASVPAASTERVGKNKMLKPAKTYEDVYNAFKWQIPEFYNIGIDICDKWARQRYRLALI